MVVLILIGTLAVAAIVGTLIQVSRDGYRRIPDSGCRAEYETVAGPH